MLTNIYHITYSEANKEADLFFWGCNIDCKGCYCKRRIYSAMLDDFTGKHLNDPKMVAKPPVKFLTFDEVMDKLSKLDLKSIILDGQEAGIDPAYPLLTKAFHEKFNTYNTVLSNGHFLPDLTHTDKVEVGIKAITDSLHIDYTGISNTTVLENTKKIYEAGKDLLVESVLIPGYIDSGEVERVAKFVADIDENIPFVVLPYFKAGDNPWRRPTPAEMEYTAGLVKKHLKNVYHFKGNEEPLFTVDSVFPKIIKHIKDEEKATRPEGEILPDLHGDGIICQA